MSPEISLKYPNVEPLMHESYDDKPRENGMLYFTHPEWMGDRAMVILTNLQPRYSDTLTKDRIEAITIGCYTHDAGEKKPLIMTREVVESVASGNRFASEVGYCFVLLTHDKTTTPFLTYTKEVVTLSPDAIFIKTLDILNNLIVWPKPNPHKDTYSKHILEYIESVEYFLNISYQYADAPWLKEALNESLKVAYSEMADDLEDEIQLWLSTKVAALESA